MHYVGIDWADEKHQVAVVNADGKVISEWLIDHNWKGFTLLDEHLKSLAPVQINLERSDGLLVDWLVQQNYAVFVTPPRVAASYRPRRSKDDREDARLLANLLRTQNEEARPLVKHSQKVEHLRQLVRALEQNQSEIVRFSNRLREILKAYYPVVVNLFSDVTTGIALAFIKAYPRPEQARALSLEELESFLRQQHYAYMKRLFDIHQALQAPVPTAQVNAGYEAQSLGFVAMLEVLTSQLKKLKKEVMRVFASHEEAAWWASLPGAGELTAPRLLAWLGDNREAFSSALVLQAFAGTVPVTRRSGKQHQVQFRWACNKALRRAITDFARNSISKSAWARSYFYSQTKRGHRPQRAYRALANRWVRILWTIWSKREAYNELKHVANRSRNGLTEESKLQKGA
jgi:transposase